MKKYILLALVLLGCEKVDFIPGTQQNSFELIDCQLKVTDGGLHVGCLTAIYKTSSDLVHFHGDVNGDGFLAADVQTVEDTAYLEAVLIESPSFVNFIFNDGSEPDTLTCELIF